MRILDKSLTFLQVHISRRIFTISTANLNRLITFYLRNDCLVKARKLFDQNPTSLDVTSWNMMIKALVQRNRIWDAKELFDQMPVRGVVSWNTMLMGLRMSKDKKRIFQCFVEMRRFGLNPDVCTFSILVDAFSGPAFKVLVTQMHALVICLGLNCSGYVGSALVKAYTRTKNLSVLDLERIFDDILHKDVSSWNMLIQGYMKLGCVDEGERAFDEMPEKDIVTWHTMVIGYTKNVRINRARVVFDQMSEKNVVSWTAMISGYVQIGKFMAALKLFQTMVESGCRPNHYTFSIALDACASSSSLVVGRQLHSSIIKFGVACDIIVSTSLLDMYGKSGDIFAASCVFKSMQLKSLASWNSMIGSFARHGLGTNALEEFEKMIDSGMKPDQVTYINLLSACAHTGLVQEGEKQFALMEKYGMTAEKEHYACMVDLYGRAGQLDKAEKLIKSMPFEPDVVIWGAMLGACGLYSSLELGEFAAEGISKLRSDHPAAYEVLSRIHSEKGVQPSVTGLQKLMKKKNVRKQDASSWIEASLDVK